MNASKPCYAHRFPSPLGDVFAVVDEQGALLRLDFVGSTSRAATERGLECQMARRGWRLAWSPERLAPVTRAVEAYFEGACERFELDLAPEGTPFQRAVWTELARVPFGTTVSYAELARRVGRPRAVRAVGRANATNPISLVMPCHRVVGSDGSLTGYAGGLERKRALLEHEGALEAARA